jgi:F0F1-type ATP synthase membrane subunit b/b'
MESVIASSVNFLILVVIMVYKLRAPVREFVAQRHHSIREEIQEVRIQLQQAQEKYDEFSAKLKAVDAEVATLQEQTKQDTLAMKQRIVNESRKMASTIASDARNSVDSLHSELKGQLYAEWSLQVLDRAEQILKDRLTSSDRSRIGQEFSKQMESVQ